MSHWWLISQHHTPWVGLIYTAHPSPSTSCSPSTYSIPSSIRIPSTKSHLSFSPNTSPNPNLNPHCQIYHIVPSRVIHVICTDALLYTIYVWLPLCKHSFLCITNGSIRWFSLKEQVTVHGKINFLPDIGSCTQEPETVWIC